MFKLTNRRDVDRHVSQMCQRLSETERSGRGYSIAKSYGKVGEYELARDWLQRYLDIKADDAAAHKYMGELYELLNKPELAITSFQRSYQLNSKQNDLIKNICKLFLVNDGWSSSPSKAKYWCELADSENIRDDSVLSLRLKMLNKDKKNDSKPVEEMILKEITARPHDVGLRIRLVKFLLDEKRIAEAFKYCFDVEMKFMEIFLLSIDWYTTLSTVLQQQTTTDSWNYWCMLLISIERQIFLNLKKDLSLQAIKQNNIKEVTSLLFEFDQILKKAHDALMVLAPVKELAEEFINHFRGQFALYTAALMFQKQKISNNDQWRDTTRKCLPFLLFAFQYSTVNTEAFWLKNTNETIRHLFGYLKKEGSFRCAQAARTILACKSTSNDGDISAQIRNYKVWTTIDDIFNQVREQCADLNWRKNIYRVLFANADQQSNISSSYFVQTSCFQEPNYEIISFNDVDTYESIAQHLYPSSLEHHVYLGLGRKDLFTYKSNTFSSLNLSTSNLINCNPETINRIDIDSFLYCAIMQAKRRLEAEKICYESYSSKPSEKPIILPAVNMVEGLCTEEQSEWWLAAFKIYRNISGENMAQLKATLQFGIEAVRGIDTPKVDVIILLKLGDTLLARSGACDKMDERRHFELRVEYIYKFAMKMLRNREADNMRRIFKFTTTNYDVDREVDQLAGTAIGYLSSIYFKREEYKEFVDDFDGIPNAWAHFFRAEAYKKLDENSKTPKKSRKIYIEKARENLMETLTLLDNSEHIDKNNPLRMRVEKDLKRLQYNLSSSFNDELDFNNVSQNGYADEEVFHNASASSFRGRGPNVVLPNYNEKFLEVESLIRKLNDLVVSVKDDVRNDITDLKDELLNIRGDITDLNVNKDASTSKVMTDVYKSIEEISYNVNHVTYMMGLMTSTNVAGAMPQNRFPPNPMQAQFNQMFNTAYPMYMQYPTSTIMPRQPVAGQIPGMPFGYGDPMGSNLMINPQTYSSPQPMIPSPQQNAVVPPSPATQQQLVGASQKSSLLEALNTPTLLNTWNNTYSNPLSQTLMNPPALPSESYATSLNNVPLPIPPISNQMQTTISNKPVEKVPPVNVVITSSDPLPAQNSVVSQPPLSVTIPPQHIKHAPAVVQQQQPLFTTSSPATNKTSQYENVSPAKLDTSEYLEEPSDYDPRPDFKAIIPLPDEIEVKTGEENEEVMWSDRCKLFRFVENEWKERGIGNMKILRDKATNKCRIVMRREQIHKLCANHALTSEMVLKPTQKDNQWIWGANDYSEGSMQLEKFLVRFKTVEQGEKFKTIFEKAKKLTPKSDDTVTPAQSSKPKEPLKAKDTNSKKIGTSDFSFATPVAVPSKNVTAIAPEKGKEATQAQSSPFANFTFGQGSTKSFSELFSNISANKATPSASIETEKTTALQTTSTSLNKSAHDEDDVLEQYEPNVQFEPVIPLPDLVEAKTGEEEENVVFAHRAKLLRFDDVNKEWKERGVGEMKVLVHKTDSSKARLLMRREQVLKLCCNMVITKDLKFTQMNATTLSFGGQDFSEGEMRLEKLAIKFKTSDLCQSFNEAVKDTQNTLIESTTKPQNEEPETKKEDAKGFGDKFKPKAGSWTCEACYISNKSDVLYCVACDSPKDNTVPKKEAKSILAPSADAPKFSFGMPTAGGFSFGAPPAAVITATATTSAPSSTVTTSFSFGGVAPSLSKDIVSARTEKPAPVEPETPETKKDETKGFGDLFKPKAGAWTCEGCYVSNKGENLYCVACDSPKDSTVPKKEAKSVLQQSADAPKFSFGMPATGGFSVTAQPAAPMSVVSEQVTSTTSSVTSGFSFGAQKSFSFGSITKPEEKPAEPVAPAVSDLKNQHGFNFVFNKKSPSKSKSPSKNRNDSVNSEGGGDEDDNEYHVEEENQTYFTPVITLPEKVEVKTGEEDEELLYSHRAKLFRFIDKEWKERGVGDVKILRHRVTNKLRVIMRRDLILKLCLNFVLTDEIEFKRKEDKSWNFAASDFSEGEIEPTYFAIRFKNKEFADDFKKAVDDALAGVSQSGKSYGSTDAEILKRLMLPENFFDYISAPECAGCVGCKPDEYVFPTYKSDVTADSNPLPLEPPVTYIKIKPRKPSREKRVSFSISENKEESDSEKLKEPSGTKLTDLQKSNSMTGGLKKSEGSTNIFATFNAENPPVIGTSASTPIFGSNIFGGGKTSFATSGSSLFSSLNTTPTPITSSSSTTTETVSAPTIFGTAPTLPNASIGGLFGSKTSFATNGNLFGSANKENGAAPSVFGAGAQPVFGQNSIFGGSLSFGAAKPSEALPKSTSGPTSTFSFTEAAKDLEKSKDKTAPTIVPDFIQKSSDFGGFAALAASASSPEKGFLTTSATENKPTGGFFGLTVKDDIFTKLANKKNDSGADTSHNDSENVNDDNYDPHYEPIISLPEEIKVSTGEEDEDKIFYERAKLFRYDSNTKEWKERGVGEIKILHHPVNGTYRLILRREQIFKLVLNQLLTNDLHMTPMNNSPKAFCWVGVNYAEGSGEAEQLAIRFKNEDLANTFKNKVDDCIAKLESRENLKPEND